MSNPRPRKTGDKKSTPQIFHKYNRVWIILVRHLQWVEGGESVKGGEKEGRKVAKESLALVILQCILLIFLSPRVNVHSLLLPMVVTSYLSTARHTKQKEENERTVQS